MVRIYLDFDLCASPFSFDAEADATEDGAIKRTIDKTYDHKDDPDGQDEDYAKVREYFEKKLMPFLNAYQSRITILTANSARNVRAILLHFAEQTEVRDDGTQFKFVVAKDDRLIKALRIVSIFDDKGTLADMNPNLFGAVVKKIKNDGKPDHKQKPIEQIATQFRVSVDDILDAESKLSVPLFQEDGTTIPSPVRTFQIEQEVTKAAYIESEERPFIFLDDSTSEIDSVKTLIDGGVIGKAFNIARPGRNAPFENCGMFNQTPLDGWRGFLDRCIHDLSNRADIDNRKKRKKERTRPDIRTRASRRTRASKRRTRYAQLVLKPIEF